MKYSFYTSLILLFTLSSLLKIDYSTSIPVDFGGFSAETENSLVVDTEGNAFEKVIEYLHEYKDIDAKCSNFQIDIKNKYYQKLKLNKYIFPQIISKKYLYPDYIHLINTNRRVFIVHQIQDDSDPFIS